MSTTDLNGGVWPDHYGTSAACMMVAGVVVAVQSVWKAECPGTAPIMPWEMRTALRDTGTWPPASPWGPDAAGDIGPLPDIRQLVEYFALTLPGSPYA